MNRHQQRLKLMIAIYQFLLLHKDLADVADEIQTTDTTVNEYFYDVLEQIDKHEEQLITKIDACLIDWDYNRLGYIEQAILLLGSVEIIYLDYDRAVVIDEAIKLAKDYCDDETYKLINGVLDQV
ncbi:Transcription antitermination protein NusB [bioreactor metagenome]|uniref:Transcription antitermination protein NusB n=1 Tax=bioreactor metagenome TaxID=1076179 RepID=A0A645CNL1_9ZZZZ|nr:transcription antitermination factor NusB [Erysipelotrichaceae bacterium]